VRREGERREERGRGRKGEREKRIKGNTFKLSRMADEVKFIDGIVARSWETGHSRSD
jgi:hypothetical protein